MSGRKMKYLLMVVLAVYTAGCGNVGQKGSQSADPLVGIYEGKDVIDTEERLTLNADRTFEYDFIPLGQTGASYRGRWRSEAGIVVLIGKLQTREEEEFSLGVGSFKSSPSLIYTWDSYNRQRAAMLIPNVFVRSNEVPAYHAILPSEKAPNHPTEPLSPSRGG
jgi:hypothetical protein